MRSFVLLAAGFAAVVGCGGSEASSVATGDDANLTSGKVLLDCNVFESGGGPDQQATVIQKNGALVLKELTNSGAMVERPLTQAEWDGKDITLRHDRYDGPSTKNHLWKENGDWMNESKGDGFSSYGYADCFTDKTK